VDLLTCITFLPLLGALALVVFPREKPGAMKWFTLLVTVVAFILSLKIFIDFKTVADMQFERSLPWIPSLGISYHIGIDGLSLFLYLLVTFLMPITVLSSFNAVASRVKEFYLFMLLLETAMLGTFIALDMFLFYVFWELMLIPMYFLIGMWGGERRIYATIKFFIYTMAGSLLMLVAILVLAFAHKSQTGVLTFNLADLYNVSLGESARMLLFLAFALSFAVKVPMFPFHTWLPDAHVEAPTAGSVILAGVLLKMGTYGFLRFAMPLFPEAALKMTPVITGLAVAGIIYGALVAMVQKDAKKLVAYSSVSHLGFVMLGLFVLNVQAVEGAVYQMLNHGLSTGALFLLVGVIYERRHTRLMAAYGGIAGPMPFYAVLFMLATLSSIGLPPLNGFVGEFLILMGVFKFKAILAALAGTGVVLGAIYMLWMYQRVFFGQIKDSANKALKDLSPREILVFVPIVIMIVLMGVYPKPFLSRMEPSVNKFISTIKPVRATEAEVSQPVEFTLEKPAASSGGHEWAADPEISDTEDEISAAEDSQSDSGGEAK